MNTPELTKYEKNIFKKVRKEWTKLGFRIYSDNRKKFYRMKLYRATKYYATKAKKIAKTFGVEATVEEIKYFSYSYIINRYNCVIRHPYFNAEN